MAASCIDRTVTSFATTIRECGLAVGHSAGTMGLACDVDDGIRFLPKGFARVLCTGKVFDRPHELCSLYAGFCNCL